MSQTITQMAKLIRANAKVHTTNEDCTYYTVTPNSVIMVLPDMTAAVMVSVSHDEEELHFYNEVDDNPVATITTSDNFNDFYRLKIYTVQQ